MAAGSTYTPIATYTAPSAQASYTFNSFSGYTDILLVCSVQTVSNDNVDMQMQVNSDTASNYSRTYLLGDGTSPISGRNSNATVFSIPSISGQSVNAGVFTPIIINLQNYANTTTYKTFLARSANAKGYEGATVGLWRSTAAITSILVQPSAGSFNTGSTFTLYGIAKA